jgi:hypothetical protein
LILEGASLSGVAGRSFSMRPTSDFDPDRPARLHEVLNDKVISWRTGWAREWRRNSMADDVDGTMSWDGLIFDGWEPSGVDVRR